jgi:hypothetical protein
MVNFYRSVVIRWLTRQSACRRPAIFFRFPAIFSAPPYIRARQAVDFTDFQKKMRPELKARFTPPLSPFEAASALMAAT